MATFEELERQWAADGPINQTKLDTESASIPKLHHKYYSLLVQELVALKNAEDNLRVLERDKWIYFNGMMTDEELRVKKWIAFDIHVKGKDVDRFMDADQDLIKSKQRYAIQNEKVNYLKSILQQVNTRGYQIKNIIEWKRFEHGG